MPEKREGAVTLKGDPVALLGAAVSAGDSAPDFTALAGLGEDWTLSAQEPKVRILLSVPSLDTPVCQTEIKRFNEEAAALSDDIEIDVISVDTPFAQARFCGAEGVERVKTISDFKDRAFGTAYGVEIDGLAIYARAAFVVDKSGKVTYAEYVPEVADEPNYDAILAAAKAAVG